MKKGNKETFKRVASRKNKKIAKQLAERLVLEGLNEERFDNSFNSCFEVRIKNKKVLDLLYYYVDFEKVADLEIEKIGFDMYCLDFVFYTDYIKDYVYEEDEW